MRKRSKIIFIVAIAVTCTLLFWILAFGPFAQQQNEYSYNVSGAPSFVNKNAKPLCTSASNQETARAERENLPLPKVENPAYCSKADACKDDGGKLLVSYDRDSLVRNRTAYIYLATSNGSSIGKVWVNTNIDGATPIQSEINGFAYTPYSTAKIKISGDVISTAAGGGLFNSELKPVEARIQVEIESDCNKPRSKVVLSDSFTPTKAQIDAENRKYGQ